MLLAVWLATVAVHERCLLYHLLSEAGAGAALLSSKLCLHL